MSEHLIADADNQKLRGGYYTPPEIAKFLARWAIRSPKDHILEPSCGDGNLLTEAAKRLLDLNCPADKAGGRFRESSCSRRRRRRRDGD